METVHKGEEDFPSTPWVVNKLQAVERKQLWRTEFGEERRTGNHSTYLSPLDFPEKRRQDTASINLVRIREEAYQSGLGLAKSNRKR